MTSAVHVSYLIIYGAAYALLLLPSAGRCKYIEGELNTWENWAFLARFCFLSEAGQFEYSIEYEEDQGTPNLLLYYDEADQWPAVYKSQKNCQARESVLRAEQNQIVNLSTRFPFSEAAGCTVPNAISTLRPRYTYVVPTLATKPTTIRSTTPDGRTIVTQTVTVTITGDDDLTTLTSDSYTSTPDDATVSTTDSSDLNSTYSEDILLSSTTSDEALLDDESGRGVTQFFETDVIDADAEEAKPIRRKRAPIPPPQQPQAAPRYHPPNAGSSGRQVARTVSCHNARRFRTARERWWFIAISNCRGNRGIRVRYRMLMTNGEPGDYWHEHFSADEFYVLPVLMAFAVAYSFLLLAIIICSIELKQRQLLHSTYKLFVLSAMIQFVGILFKSMCYLKYAVNGVGSPALKIIGNVFMSTSETCFLLLLLLLAKGYTVTRGRLPLSAGVKVTIFMCLYVVTYISLFIYEAKVFDPGEVLYTYESPAGYGLIILRITAWCMFIYSTVFTLKHYPEKSNFYYPFNVFGTLWCIAGPAFIISANTYIDKWVRESVVCAVLLFITFGGHLMFLLLTMPSVANKNFPYHVRTTQIGVMEQSGGDIGASNIEQFGHHAYEPSGGVGGGRGNGVDQAVIIPLSRRTEDLFSGLYSQQMYTSTASSSAARRQALTMAGDDEIAARHLTANGHLNGLAMRLDDGAMDNVLAWSLAKNFNSIEAPPLRVPENDRPPALMLMAPPPEEESGTSTGNGTTLQDWIREVPVELFTVSKAVATKTNTKTEDQPKPPPQPSSASSPD